MARNTSGLRRGGTKSPGRPKGRRDKVPRSLKMAFRDVYEQLASENPKVILRAIKRGLEAPPPASAAYLRIWSEYQLGRPVERVELGGAGGKPVTVEFVQSVRSSSGGA